MVFKAHTIEYPKNLCASIHPAQKLFVPLCVKTSRTRITHGYGARALPARRDIGRRGSRLAPYRHAARNISSCSAHGVLPVRIARGGSPPRCVGGGVCLGKVARPVCRLTIHMKIFMIVSTHFLAFHPQKTKSAYAPTLWLISKISSLFLF